MPIEEGKILATVFMAKGKGKSRKIGGHHKSGT